MRQFLISILTVLLFAFAYLPVTASDEFKTSVDITYDVNGDGSSLVTYNITLENLFSHLQATSYTLVLDNIRSDNPRAYEAGRLLPQELLSESGKTMIKVNFDTPVVGKGARRNFSIVFNQDNVATKTGEVWEVNIPGVSDSAGFSDYNINLSVPDIFGTAAYISPDPDRTHTTLGKKYFVFGSEKLKTTGITAGFGAFQVFSFDISYHLENPLNRQSAMEIAIPPDTAMQRVFYEQITPLPAKVHSTIDGNWLVTYELKPRERIDVRATGSVQIFAGPIPFLVPTADTLKANLSEDQYWETSDLQIKTLASNLKTPKAIYDYVSSNLSYDYGRVQPNVERKGAKAALLNPTSAICMEFTDLFIALARAAGIPAREINGYAYTENPEIQPLSLVSDVLHAWPEYWDERRKVWVPVDPTWGATTGGIDFFNKLDLRHFTFVIHGESSTKPFPPGSYKLGAEPQKDVYVDFGSLPAKRSSEPEIQVFEKTNLPFFFQKFVVTLTNPGPSALYDLPISVEFDGDLKSEQSIKVLPPLASYTFEVRVPFSFLGSSTPHTLTVGAGETNATVVTAKNQIIVYSLLIFCILVISLIILLLLKLKRNFAKKAFSSIFNIWKIIYKRLQRFN